MKVTSAPGGGLRGEGAPDPSRMSAGPDSVTGGTPAQERRLRAQGRATLGRLLAAGLAVFAERGYGDARVDDIARAAGVSHGTFYLYFANKAELFRALAAGVGEEMKELVDELGPVSAGRKGYEELRSWLARFGAMYEANAPVIRVWQSEETDPELVQLGSGILAELGRKFAARIAEAGSRNAVDPALAAFAFVAMIERVNYLMVVRRLAVDRDSMVDTLARVTHAGIFGGRPQKAG